MIKYICDLCCSDDIKIIKDKTKEMDCYCNNCEDENYIVSSWWINERVKNEL